MPDGIYVFGSNNQGQAGLDSTGILTAITYFSNLNVYQRKIADGNTTGFIKTDNTLWLAGDNDVGQCAQNNFINYSSPVQEITGGQWEQISSGNKFMVATKQDGSLWSWGQNTSGQLGDNTTISRTSPVREATSEVWDYVSAGYEFVLATRLGRLYAWGNNSSGQLGISNVANVSVPTQIGTATDWQLPAAGYLTAGCIKTDGTLWTWGSATSGVLGNNVTVSRSSPVQVGSDNTWTTIYASYNNFYAQKGDSTVWGWGVNTSGQLAQNNVINRSSPVLLGTYNYYYPIINNIYTIDVNNKLWGAGSYLSGKLLTRNGLPGNGNASSLIQLGNVGYEWLNFAVQGAANNNTIRLIGNAVPTPTPSGTGPTPTATLSPTPTPTATFPPTPAPTNTLTPTVTSSPAPTGTATPTPAPPTPSSTAPTPTPSIAPLADQFYVWGDNTTGEYSNNTQGGITQRSTPIFIAVSDWATIPSGGDSISGVKNNGTLYMWGLNSSGELGQNNIINRSTPTQVGVSSDWSWVMNDRFTIGVKTNGTLWAWGNNSSGQLGLNDIVSRSSPVQIGADNTWSRVYVSRFYSGAAFDSAFAIKTNGSLWAWGNNSAGQLGFIDAVNRSSPVQVGADLNWSSVAVSGQRFALAIKTNGTLWSCGINTNGSLGINNTINRSSWTQVGTNSNWTQVSADYWPVGAIKSDGTLWTWGQNTNGSLGSNIGSAFNRSSPAQVGSETTWAQIECGYASMLGRKVDGTMWGWGTGSAGQLGINTTQNQSSPVLVSGGLNWFTCSANNRTSFGIVRINAATSTPTATIASTPTPTPSPSESPIPTTTLSPTVTESPTPSPSPSESPSPTPSPSESPSPTPSPSPSESPTPTPSPSPTTLIDLYAWGSNANGQLGLNDTITRFTPTFQSQSSEYVGVNPPYSVAGSNAGIVKSDGTAWVWGNNTQGSLGLNNVINYSSPVQLGTENNWSQILIGNTNSLAIKKDGTLWGWGSNGSSALGNIISIFDTISSPIQLVTETGWTNIGQAPSNIGTTLVKNDGTLWLSGSFGSALQVSYSSFTQYGTDTNWKIVTNWGGANFLAFKTDGTMWSTGTNSVGQLGLGDTINRSSWTQIGTANNWVEGTMQSSVCALNTLNELWVWGFNSSGQLGQNDIISRSSPVQIAGSWRIARSRGSVIIGVKTDGTLWGCGLAGTGMLGISLALNKSSMVQTVIADNYWIDLDCVQSGVFAFRQANVPTPTVTLSPTPSPSESPTPTPTESPTPSPSPSESPTPSPTESPTPSPSESPSPTPTESPTPSPSPSESPTLTPTFTPSPTPSPSPSPTPSPTATCTPVPLPVTSGMVGWFDASDTSKINGGTPTNGVQVSSWGNSTTNATWTGMQQATSVKQPTWFSDGTVAGSYVLFDNTAGANADGMTTNGAYSLSGACTIVVMEDAPASISPSHRTVQSSSINALISLNQYGGPTPIGCFYGASIVSGYQSGTGKHNGIMTKSAANAIKYYVDGTDRTSGTPTSTSNWAQVCFGGAGANANEPANTKVLEVIVYDRELSAAEVTQVSDYLQCKWTNPGPTPQPTIGPATASPTPSPSVAPATASPTPSPSASETPSPTPSASEAPATPTPSPTIGTVSAWWGWGSNTGGSLSIGNTNQVTGLYNPQPSDFTQIAIGTAFFGLKADNTLWVCGSNTSAQLGLGDVIPRSSMVQATGSWTRAISNVNMSSGIKADGTLWTWGAAGQGSAAINLTNLNTSTPVQEILGKTDWVTHFIGSASQLAIDSAGKLWTVGSDSSGNQGLNTLNVAKSTFTQIGAGTDWSSTFVSNAFSAALKTNGSVYVWGLNTLGQIGDGTNISKSSPVQVVSDKTISKIVGSSGGIILLDTSGNLWGTGQQQLGLNDITPRSSYTQIASGVLDACANGSNILFIKTDNTLWGVGSGGSPLLNASLVNVSSPIMLDNTFSWQYFNSIRGTFQPQTFAYANGLPQPTPTATASPTPTPTPSATPEVLNWWGWGVGTNGQMGNGLAVNINALNNFYPSSVYADVAIGNNGLFRKQDSTLWQAGLNSYGRLGINSTVNQSSQVQITGANFASFGISNVQTRIFPNGTLWSAGQGANGGLANNTIINASSPVQESLGKTDWVESFGFSNCQVALDSSGRLWSCGFNGQGQLGKSDLINRSQFVQIGADTNWVDVTVGTVNFIAKKNNNTYWTCGSNSTGQFGLNNVIPASSPIQIGGAYTIQKIAGGSTITFILDNAGNIWSTGSNTSGTIGDGTVISKSSWVQMIGGPWIDVKPCATTVFMIKSDNTLWAVGALNANLSLNTFATAQSSPVMIDNTKTWLRFSEQVPGSNSMSAQGVQAGFPTPTPT
jgi:alpha-tubulin suppressor-like RCC1 family protein